VALSAQAGSLNRRMKQEPQRHALAEGRGVFLPCIPICLVKCTPENHGPIVPRPFRRAPPISGTPWVSIFRAAGPAAPITAYARKKMPAVIAHDLGHRGPHESRSSRLSPTGPSAGLLFLR